MQEINILLLLSLTYLTEASV